jgi:SlyX protein
LSDPTESIQRLEEKIAYLERHVTEQDKAMLEISDDITRLSRELKALRERDGGGGQGGGGEEATPDERPPHY